MSNSRQIKIKKYMLLIKNCKKVKDKGAKIKFLIHKLKKWKSLSSNCKIKIKI